ncbi:MAG TPA: helix-turn-helix domain-containing protein [Saprospiraceae bacterium]|nr:helix-turn-helix domain-containing protein [Saprospiraceae bacterium]
MISSKKIAKIPLTSFTADQVAEILGVSTPTVYNYTKRGVRVTNDLYIKLERNDTTRISKTALIKFRDQIDA